ncbi:hypothetical protein [Estrella lausannensis]|uniref:Conserved putative membrane protein n=1 Tax=Estrella lausannensis TaxID=483423 RepID=A0A0H5DSR8_9BACT|nr:hypothetical protein [Estrella lausannensis]CRX38849.1 Conserved putative membrane protein [Estrella lausannensis]
MSKGGSGLRPLLLTVLFYTLPLSLIIGAAGYFGISLYSSKFLSMGLFVISMGSIAIYMELRQKVSSELPQEELPPVAEEPLVLDFLPAEGKESEEAANTAFLQLEKELREEIAFRNEEIQRLNQERERERVEKELKEEELDSAQRLFEEKLEEEKLRNIGLQETVSDLKSRLEFKQEEIDKLGGKIRDLTYEIKTLLQIADMSIISEVRDKNEKEEDLFRNISLSSPPLSKSDKVEKLPQDSYLAPESVKNLEDAKKQLRRCLDIAQKITGSHYIRGQAARFRDMADHYALDLRRLCDSLRSENGAAVIVYSPRENRLLFINNHVKTILGYSPEKFVQDFESIVQEGMGDWKKVVGQLSTLHEAKTSLVMKNKNNEDVVVQCLLGMIPTGVFKSHVMGVLYH